MVDLIRFVNSFHAPFSNVPLQFYIIFISLLNLYISKPIFSNCIPNVCSSLSLINTLPNISQGLFQQTSNFPSALPFFVIREIFVVFVLLTWINYSRQEKSETNKQQSEWEGWKGRQTNRMKCAKRQFLITNSPQHLTRFCCLQRE